MYMFKVHFHRLSYERQRGRRIEKQWQTQGEQRSIVLAVWRAVGASHLDELQRHGFSLVLIKDGVCRGGTKLVSIMLSECCLVCLWWLTLFEQCDVCSCRMMHKGNMYAARQANCQSSSSLRAQSQARNWPNCWAIRTQGCSENVINQLPHYHDLCHKHRAGTCPGRTVWLLSVDTNGSWFQSWKWKIPSSLALTKRQHFTFCLKKLNEFSVIFWALVRCFIYSGAHTDEQEWYEAFDGKTGNKVGGFLSPWRFENR